MNQRQQQLQQLLIQQELDGILLTRLTNIRYLCGYTGEDAWLLLPAAGEGALLTDFRYQQQAAQQCGDLPVLLWQRAGLSPSQLIAKFCRERQMARLAIESGFMTVAFWQNLQEAAPELTLCPTEDLTQQLRLIKDSQEQSLIREACRRTDLVFAQICRELAPGLSEKQIAGKMLAMMDELDCEPAFPTIVAAGENGACPHHQPTAAKKLAPGELVTMDFGCKYQGYCSDITRTVALGAISSQLAELYQIVLTAQQAGLAAILPGRDCREADEAARQVIRQAGYDKYFGHAAGHGLGLDIHEGPTLSPASSGVLRPGCFVTMEPGIYVPGLGGVRIEDTVLVTESGSQPLFCSSKELLCLS